MTDTARPDVRQALSRLRDGNRRFASGTANRFSAEEAEIRRKLAKGQAPSAVVLTCSDSRVHPTLVFDQGLGDLFTVRVAGNVVSPEALGSIEFAVGQLGTRFIMVLGHTQCGAIGATLEEMRAPSPDVSPNLRSITDRIRPVVESVLEEGAEDGRRVAALDAMPEEERAAVLERAVRANVSASVRALREGSALLDRLAAHGSLEIVGAEYCLETGIVDFFDERGDRT